MSNNIAGPSSVARDFPVQPLHSNPEERGFGDVLKGAIGEVDSLYADAQQKVTAMLQGHGEDLHSAMIALQKADLSFQMMMQVRNKVVNAYQEIARMQF
ncbi:MAG TPA: flagellar hook-basal body complex protein FliE [Candidatus Nanoarchaeia archaeon]|nr:flagellar hook-basal body complex protein FliE [Candidatus Nanoarchaeia archaeon]